LTSQYQEYPNLCFVDTLDNVAGLRQRGRQADFFGALSDENVARIKRQNSRKISVIIGNPPYNANQLNENENNKNRTYPAIDERIKETYIAASTAQKTKLYDMYARFFRWASDRIDENGIIAFISNSSFIDSKTFDGFRKLVAQEFNELWVINLKGNARTSGERRRQEGGNIFNDRIRIGVAVYFCVKKSKLRGCRILYQAVRDYAKADEKLEFLTSKPIGERTFDEIKPDAKNNWINITDNDFDSLMPLASKETKAAKRRSIEATVFKLFSNGVNTARDEWVYDFDEDELARKIRFMVKVYNSEQVRVVASGKVDRDNLDTSVKWSAGLIGALLTKKASFGKNNIITATYRPFVRIKYYADELFSDRLTGNHSAIFWC
jgi:predicted helicase